MRKEGINKPTWSCVFSVDTGVLFYNKGDNDLLIVSDVALREHSALAILEPLLADLVTTDVEIPYGLGYAFEAGRLVPINPDRLSRP